MPYLSPRKFVMIAFFILAGFLCAACSGGNRVRNAQSADHRIRPGDVIEVSFEHYSDFNQTTIVGPDGHVSLQAVGELDVSELSSAGLEVAIMQRYEDILPLPKVTVNVHEAKAFTVYFGGQINEPGILEFKSDMTVTQGIIMAGGLKDKVHDHEIYVFRNRGNRGLKTFKMRLHRAKRIENAPRNFKLAPYDVVFVMQISATSSGFGTEI